MQIIVYSLMHSFVKREISLKSFCYKFCKKWISLFLSFYLLRYIFLIEHATIKQSFWHIITRLLQNVCGTYNNNNDINCYPTTEIRDLHYLHAKNFFVCVWYAYTGLHYDLLEVANLVTYLTKRYCNCIFKTTLTIYQKWITSKITNIIWMNVGCINQTLFGYAFSYGLKYFMRVHSY